MTCEGASAKLANVLKDAGLAASATAAYRLIEQGAVRVDGERVGSPGCRPGRRFHLSVAGRKTRFCPRDT